MVITLYKIIGVIFKSFKPFILQLQMLPDVCNNIFKKQNKRSGYISTAELCDVHFCNRSIDKILPYQYIDFKVNSNSLPDNKALCDVV